MRAVRTALATALLTVAASPAGAQYIVEMEDGSVYEWTDLNIRQRGDDWSISKTTSYNPNTELSKIKAISVATMEARLAAYKAPSGDRYNDNYVARAGWGSRASWNLANVHDPTVMRADDGYYYMFQTDAGYGNPIGGSNGHFYCRRSKNLVEWEAVGAVMKSLPAWVKPKLNEIRAEMGLGESTVNWSGGDFGYWAPCARRVSHDLYRLYYVITIPGYIDGPNTWGERAFIGLMETDNPADANSWQDRGFVITNYSDRNLSFRVSPTAWQSCYYKYNAIDPSYVITPEGDHWLVYGSWHSGFAAVQLDAETGKPLTDPLPNPWGAANEAAYGKRIFTRNASDRWQGSEAPEVVYNPETGYYYLFLAYDELAVAYNTRVVRSRNITGPYYRYGSGGGNGSNVTTGGDAYPIVTHPYKFADGDGWVGISHCCIFDDGQGNWFYASQARFPENVGGNPYSNALMVGHVRSIRWTEEGWPIVMPERYGAVPQAPISEDELVGQWENITLKYEYRVQQKSVTITLGEDHKVQGAPFTGSEWSWDAEKRILKIGSNYKLYVQRELDWEASPRKATIVYAGYNYGGTQTYWGKKKQ